MKQEKLSFKLPKVKHRMHFVLFDEDTPFRPKVVNRKPAYQRKPKHKTQDWNQND